MPARTVVITTISSHPVSRDDQVSLLIPSHYVCTRPHPSLFVMFINLRVCFKCGSAVQCCDSNRLFSHTDQRADTKSTHWDSSSDVGRGAQLVTGSKRGTICLRRHVADAAMEYTPTRRSNLICNINFERFAKKIQFLVISRKSRKMFFPNFS